MKGAVRFNRDNWRSGNIMDSYSDDPEFSSRVDRSEFVFVVSLSHEGKYWVQFSLHDPFDRYSPNAYNYLKNKISKLNKDTPITQHCKYTA